jgi:acetylornithine deacetylase/succinyl-diaminopimelate desuccinylase-like protein
VDRAVVAPAALMTFSGGRTSGDENTSEDHKLVRTDSLGLIVKTPAETAEKIIQIAQGAGGLLGTSNVNGGADTTSASLSIRVPAEKFDEVRAQIRKLSLRVESESIDAQDVTKQYVDLSTRKHACATCGLGKAVSKWRAEAARYGLAKGEIDRMASAFEHDGLKAALAAR